eukprot:5511719-Prymnesium_polylepis.3
MGLSTGPDAEAAPGDAASTGASAGLVGAASSTTVVQDALDRRRHVRRRRPPRQLTDLGIVRKEQLLVVQPEARPIFLCPNRDLRSAHGELKQIEDGHRAPRADVVGLARSALLGERDHNWGGVASVRHVPRGVE